jgi:hypothetical protein
MAMRVRRGWITEKMTGRVLRRALMSVLLATGAYALPAYSATIVQVRVGPHPEFTRVVFEMDQPSGYRVERQTLPDGSGELVVTIDASSRGRSIRSRSPLVDVVSVEESLGRAVARIRLKSGKLAIREMILTAPPRIVLDVMVPESEGPVAATPAATREPPTEAPAPVPEVVAGVIPEPEPEPAVEMPAELPEPPAEPAAEEPPLEEPEIFAEALPDDLEVAPHEAGDSGFSDAEAEPIGEVPIAPAETIEPVIPAPEAEEVVTSTPAWQPEPAPEEEGGGFELPFGITPMRVALAGLLLLLGVAAVFVRRRSLPSDVEVTPFGMEAGDDGGFVKEPTGTAESAAVEDFPPETIARGVGADAAPDEPGTFVGPERREGAMHSETQDMPIQRGDAQSPPKFSGDEETELMQIVQDMQRRMAHLESRLDESNAARECLERQVAAQSEELRVQRAAIARTQRALRGLVRSEDDATEPALREPRKGANPGA